MLLSVLSTLGNIVKQTKEEKNAKGKSIKKQRTKLIKNSREIKYFQS